MMLVYATYSYCPMGDAAKDNKALFIVFDAATDPR
jgi:hypothetical protein